MEADRFVDILRNAWLPENIAPYIHPVWAVETANGRREIVDRRTSQDSDPEAVTFFEFRESSKDRTLDAEDLDDAVGSGLIVPSGRRAEYDIARDLVASRHISDPFSGRRKQADRLRMMIRERWSEWETPAIDGLIDRWCGDRCQAPERFRLCDAAFDASTPWLEPADFPITHRALNRFDGLVAEAQQFVDGRISAPHYGRDQKIGLVHEVPAWGRWRRDQEIGLVHEDVSWGRWTLVTGGRRMPEEWCEPFPVAAALHDELEAAGFPVLNLAFLILAPHTRLPYHTDGFAMFGSWHLGLIVPPLCAFELADQVTPAEAGECYAFEDAWVHRVWNASDQPRVMLSAWCAHPSLTPSEKEALTMITREASWAV